MRIEITPIGRVHASRQEAEDDYWGAVESCIELDAALDESALAGIEAFSHVEVLFFFHAVAPEKVATSARHPRGNRDWPLVGIFAQRGKNRPNRLGSTMCRVVRREGRRLWVSELDAIDGTPVLDLKPVMQEFLPREAVRQPGWSTELMRTYWAQAE